MHHCQDISVPEGSSVRCTTVLLPGPVHFASSPHYPAICTLSLLCHHATGQSGSKYSGTRLYHPQSQSYPKTTQVRSTIIGYNGRVILGHASKLCLEQIWHTFFTPCLQFSTHYLFGPDFTVQPSPVQV